MAIPFIFDRARAESGPERARRSIGAILRTMVEFAVFSVVALAILIAVAAIRVIAYLH